jgi:transposase
VSHRNARLNVRGRLLLVERVCVRGWPVARAAKAQGISRQCASRWVGRFGQEGEAGLYDRSSRPYRCLGRTPAAVEEQIVEMPSTSGGRALSHSRAGRPLPAKQALRSRGCSVVNY